MLIKRYNFIIQIIIKIAEILKKELPEEDYEFAMLEHTKRILKEFFGD